MATLAYPYSVRDSTNSSTDNRKTGLTPTVSAGKTLAASPAAVLASTVSVVEVGSGDYIALYDPETNGDASFPVDWGSGLTNPNDRYGTLILTRDAGRVLGSLSAAGAGLTTAERSAVATAILTDTTSSDESAAGSLGHLVTTAPGWYSAPPAASAISTAVVAGMASAPVGSVTAPVTLPSSVPSGYATAAAQASLATTIGTPVGASISADIQTRSTYAGGAVASVTGSVGSVTGSVGSVTAPVTLPTNPPAAYATSAAQTSLASAVGAISVPSTSAISTAVVSAMASAPVGSVTSAVTLPSTPPAGYGGGSGGGSSILANNGLDSIVVESGINARQALSLILAMVAGNDSGVGTTSLQFKAAGTAGATTTRVTFAIDGSGNRTATLNSPT